MTIAVDLGRKATKQTKSSKGAYEEVTPTSSQILSKLDLEINIGSMHMFFVYITSRIHQNCIKHSHIFYPNVYALAFLCICSYAPEWESSRTLPILLRFYYTPHKLCLWWGILFSRCPSVRPSVRPSVCPSVRACVRP